LHTDGVINDDNKNKYTNVGEKNKLVSGSPSYQKKLSLNGYTNIKNINDG
jgi:hypothetical protein